MHTYLLFFLFAYFSTALGHFEQINSLQPLEMLLPTLTSQSLVILNVENTLLVPKDKILRPCGPSYLHAFERSILANEGMQKHQYVLSRKLTQHKCELVHPEIRQLIHQLQANGVKVIALANFTGPLGEIPVLEDWYYTQLKEFELDFSFSFPDIIYVTFPKLHDTALRLKKGIGFAAGNVSHLFYNPIPLFTKGILFAGRSPKGDTLKAFFNEIEWKPDQVVVVTDSVIDLRSIQRRMKEMEVPCIGFREMKIDNLKEQFDSEIARTQFRFLLQHNVWLDDELAKTFLHIR